MSNRSRTNSPSDSVSSAGRHLRFPHRSSSGDRSAPRSLYEQQQQQLIGGYLAGGTYLLRGNSEGHNNSFGQHINPHHALGERSFDVEHNRTSRTSSKNSSRKSSNTPTNNNQFGPTSQPSTSRQVKRTYSGSSLNHTSKQPISQFAGFESEMEPELLVEELIPPVTIFSKFINIIQFLLICLLYILSTIVSFIGRCLANPLSIFFTCIFSYLVTVCLIQPSLLPHLFPTQSNFSNSILFSVQISKWTELIPYFQIPLNHQSSHSDTNTEDTKNSDMIGDSANKINYQTLDDPYGYQVTIVFPSSTCEPGLEPTDTETVSEPSELKENESEDTTEIDESTYILHHPAPEPTDIEAFPEISDMKDDESNQLTEINENIHSINKPAPEPTNTQNLSEKLTKQLPDPQDFARIDNAIILSEGTHTLYQSTPAPGLLSKLGLGNLERLLTRVGIPFYQKTAHFILSDDYPDNYCWKIEGKSKLTIELGSAIQPTAFKLKFTVPTTGQPASSEIIPTELIKFYGMILNEKDKMSLKKINPTNRPDIFEEISTSVDSDGSNVVTFHALDASEHSSIHYKYFQIQVASKFFLDLCISRVNILGHTFH